MKRESCYFFILSVVLLIVVSCQSSTDDKDELSLQGVFRDDFLIGTALSIDQINQSDAATDSVIWTQFNAITPENIMKTEEIHPEWGQYDFDAADKFVSYGENHGMHMIGHALIWHSQLSDFVQQITHADSMRTFMKEHIAAVAGRYAGRLQAWDVVNEALNEDGTYRESVFYRLLGEQYLVDAFRLAHEADPDALLYYNDYNIEQPKKREGTIRLIKLLQDAGVRVDGVGIQGHWHLGKVPYDHIEASIEAYASLGIKVMITELDIEVLPRDFQGADVSKRMEDNDPGLNPYVDGLPDSVQQQLANDYEQLFQLLLKHRDKISRVSFWGVNDAQSWLNYWPIDGRTNHPLLFDRNNQPKPAFYRVINTNNN